MNPRLEASLRPHLDRLKPLVAVARARRFWIKCGVVGIVTVGATATLGRAAIARTTAMREVAASLELVRGGLERWRLDGVLPDTSEHAIWETSARSLAALDSTAADPLLVARRVADRADRVGVEELSIRMAATDTLAAGPPLQVGRWTVAPVEAGLVVEFTSGIGEVVSLLGALPPQVEVAGLQISGVGDALRTTVALRLLRAEGGP